MEIKSIRFKKYPSLKRPLTNFFMTEAVHTYPADCFCRKGTSTPPYSTSVFPPPFLLYAVPQTRCVSCYGARCVHLHDAHTCTEQQYIPLLSTSTLTPPPRLPPFLPPSLANLLAAWGHDGRLLRYGRGPARAVHLSQRERGQGRRQVDGVAQGGGRGRVAFAVREGRGLRGELTVAAAGRCWVLL